MNQKVKNLIQKLGEAIHESVSESENIAGVDQRVDAERGETCRGEVLLFLRPLLLGGIGAAVVLGFRNLTDGSR